MWAAPFDVRNSPDIHFSQILIFPPVFCSTATVKPNFKFEWAANCTLLHRACTKVLKAQRDSALVNWALEDNPSGVVKLMPAYVPIGGSEKIIYFC